MHFLYNYYKTKKKSLVVNSKIKNGKQRKYKLFICNTCKMFINISWDFELLIILTVLMRKPCFKHFEVSMGSVFIILPKKEIRDWIEVCRM